jgi:nucleoid-associated protein YgaU
MIFTGSRYGAADVVEAVGPDGRTTRALATHVLEPAPGVLSYTVLEGERFDTLAARFYGEPTKYWLILDANPETLNPFDLLSPGAAIQIPKNRVVSE